MQRLFDWIKKRDWFITVPNIATARNKVYKETGEDIPVYLIQVDKFCVFSATKPDIKNPGLISLKNVCASNLMHDEVIINRDKISYIVEIKQEAT